jgi:two-component system response regulator CpxR
MCGANRDIIDDPGDYLRRESLNPTEAGRSILVIDDDVSFCKLIAEFLSGHDFRVDSVQAGPRGLARALEGSHDLILLDVMLPVLDGFQVLQQLRKQTAVPVIFLTARNAERDLVAGFEAGADDYIAKPFRPHELLARVRALLRRSSQTRTAPGSAVAVGGIELNPKTREVRKSKVPVEMTSAEFEILETLMRSAGSVVSRDELAAILYHREASPFERTIDVHISHLRRKLETADRALIQTVRGVGYIFVVPEEHVE